MSLIGFYLRIVGAWLRCVEKTGRKGLNLAFVAVMLAVAAWHMWTMTGRCLGWHMAFRMVNPRRRTAFVILHRALHPGMCRVVRVHPRPIVHLVERLSAEAATAHLAGRHRLARAHALLAAHAVFVRFLHRRIPSVGFARAAKCDSLGLLVGTRCPELRSRSSIGRARMKFADSVRYGAFKRHNRHLRRSVVARNRLYGLHRKGRRGTFNDEFHIALYLKFGKALVAPLIGPTVLEPEYARRCIRRDVLNGLSADNLAIVLEYLL